MSSQLQSAERSPSNSIHGQQPGCGVVEMLLENLTTIEKSLDQQRQDILQSAQHLIDAYWEWFTIENGRISTLYHQGQSKVGEVNLRPNAVAPNLEYRTNSGSKLVKPYLVWKSHSRKFRTNIAKSNKKGASLPLHPYASTNNIGVLKKKCTWNLNKAIELEEKLIPIRDAINGIHETQKKIYATIRKIQRDNHQGDTNE